MILHVKDGRRGRDYDHWIAFLGCEEGMARIVDAPHALEQVPLAELLARWDGAGLIISDEPIDARRFFYGQYATFGLWSSLAAGAVLVVHLGHRRVFRFTTARQFLRSGAVQGCWIVAVAGVLAFTTHRITQTGFFANSTAVAEVVRKYHSTFLPKLTAPEVRALLDRGEEVVIVDARFPEDYAEGHLDSALNIPVYSSTAERERVLADVPQSCPILVYCQSSGCPYAAEVADALALAGRTNIMLFPGGWREWENESSD